MGYNLLITARFKASELEPLRGYFDNVEYCGWGVTNNKLPEQDLLSKIENIDILITEYEKITGNIINSARKLFIIGCCRNEPGASVDIQAATKKSIPVLYTPGRNAISVAEYAFGMIISISRNIHKAHHLLRYTTELTEVRYNDKSPSDLTITSEWSLDARAPFNRFKGPELSGKNIGIVGFGAIGKEIAKKALAFGMVISVYDPYVESTTLSSFNAHSADLKDLVSQSDYIILAAKVTPETQNMFSSELFKMMKKTAYFINVARAALVDYNALFNTLKREKIAGAALDVYPEEPIPPDSPFLQLDNVLLSPHLAGASTDIPNHHSKMIVSDILYALKGSQPHRIINPDVWPCFLKKYRNRLID
jgi:D-3-phosphoglycerate dehydrogenase